jgi:phage/plasmid-associated DNA primase
MVPDFAERLLNEELPALLYFAMQGAERLAKSGGKFTPSETHNNLLLRWRMSASSVLEFLHDPESCELGDEFSTVQLALYEAYTKWAGCAGRKPIGRNTSYVEIDSTGAAAGVRRKDGHAGTTIVQGVRVVGGAGW